MKKTLQSTLCLAMIVTFIVFCFSGCIIVGLTDSRSVTARGNHETYVLNVSPFNAIKVEGHFLIRHYASHSDTVTLAVQSNVREHIIIEVINGELIARTTRRLSFGSNRAPVLTVSTPVLNRVTILGAGDFIMNDKIIADSLDIIIAGASDGKITLDVNRLSVDISGAGDVELSGNANTANFNLLGAGDIKALELQTVDTTIRLSGAGTVSISCSENLQIIASGAGNVRYRGSPRINQSTTGPVSIRQVN